MANCSLCNISFQDGDKRFNCSECLDVNLCLKCYSLPESDKCHTDIAPFPHHCSLHTKSINEYFKSNLTDNVYQSFINAFQSFKNRRCIAQSCDDNNENIKWTSYEELFNGAEKIGTFFQKNNIQRGSYIFSCMENRADYYFYEFASLFYGYIIIPFHKTLSLEQQSILISKINPSVLVISKDFFKHFITNIYDFENLKIIIYQDDEFSCDKELIKNIPKDIQFKYFLECLNSVSNEHFPHTPLNDSKFIMGATSGSTDLPKISYCYMNTLLEIFKLDISTSKISLYPSTISTFARVYLMKSILLGEMNIISPKLLNFSSHHDFIKMVRPTSFQCRTLNFTILHSKFKEKLEEYKNQNKNLTSNECESIVLNGFKNQFGDRLNAIFVGGTILTDEIKTFIQKCWGDKLYDVYGSTENYVISTNGKLCDDMEYKIIPLGDLNGFENPVGELVIKNHRFFNGYLGDSNLTKKSLINGWYSTGDIVEEYEPRKIRLLSRLKFAYKNNQGKFIFPEHLEFMFKSPKINNIFIYGNSIYPSVVAIVIPSHIMFEKYQTICEEMKNEILEEIQSISKEKNTDFYETPCNIELDSIKWTKENNFINEADKINRLVIQSHYKPILDRIMEQSNQSMISKVTF